MNSKLHNSSKIINLLDKDKNDRKIDCYVLEDIRFVEGKEYYPDVRIKDVSNNLMYNPVQERIMSLPLASQNKKKVQIKKDFSKQEENPMFFFIYNIENYYHFLYDTLPYLISYFKLLEEQPKLKLLMNYPNSNKRSLFPFVLDTLQLMGLDNKNNIC